MASLRVPTFLLVVATVFAAHTPIAVGQTKYRLASYPLQDPAPVISPRLSGQDQEPGAAFGFSNQEKQDPQGDPMVIDPNLLQRDNPSLPPLPQLDDVREPDQKIVVKEKFAGWKQASLDEVEQAVSDPLRGNWVMIGNTGALRGTVVGDESVDVSNLPVYLLEGGMVVVQSRTDESGNFSFNNIEQGCYSLIGFGDNAFFAFGLNALEFDLALAGKVRTVVRVQATENKSTINLDWIRHFSPNVRFRVLGRHTVTETSDDPAELYGLEGLSTVGPDSVPATSVSGQEVVLTDDGMLVGRIHQINSHNGRPIEVRSGRILLLAENNVVAAADTNNYGVFRLPGIAPGNYSAVAVSADGVGCIGISVVNDASGYTGEGQEPQRAVDFSLASTEATGWLNHNAAETAYLRIVSRPLPPEPPAPCNSCMPFRNCPPRNTGMKKFFQSMNDTFDLMFYGETYSSLYGDGSGGLGGSYDTSASGSGGNNFGYGSDGGNGNYGGGYGGGGYGGGGYGGGGNGGCGCGGAGCQQCQPMMMAPPCDGCGGMGCNDCNQNYVPGAQPLLLPPGQDLPYEIQPLIPTPAQRQQLLPQDF